jgi:ATP-binding cassette subfamily C (CFTR/MRP) protein 4
MKVRVAFIAAIYRKCLSLSTSSASSTGFIVNLVSNDVQRFEDVSPFIHFLWIGPLEVLLVTYLMYLQISWAAFPAIGSLLLFIPLQGVFAKWFGMIRKKAVCFRDERIKTLSDMFSGIVVVKLYAWEHPFIKKISELRGRELKTLKSAALLRAINDAVFFASSGKYF